MSGHKRLSSDKTHLRHGVSHDNNESFHYVSAVSPSAPLPLPTVRGDDWCPKGSNSAHQGSKRTASLVSLRARDQKSQSQPCARRILISAGISESISGAANTFNSSLPSSCDQECLPESRPDERPGIWNAHPGNPWDSMSSASSFSSSPLDDWQHASDHINQSACSSSHTLFTLPTVSAGSNSASSRKSDSDSRPSFDLPGDTVTMAPLETIVAVDKSPPVTHSLKYNKVSSTGAKWIGRKNGPDGHSPDRPALQVSLGGDTKHREVRLSQEKVSYTSGDCKVKAEAVWGLAPSNNHLMVHVSRISASKSTLSPTTKDQSSSITPPIIDHAASIETAPVSPIECLRDRVWEARRKQVEDALNFLKDRGIYDAESLPATILTDHDAFLQHARAVKKALDRFKHDADCPFVNTYKGKIKNLTPSQLQHFLYCIERNTRIAKTGGEASHGSIDEDFLLPYILSRSEINAREALLKLKSIDQSSDDSGYVDLRTWKCVAFFVGGQSCSISAMNSAVGMNCFQKSDLGPAGQDVSVHQMTHVMRDGKHCFPRETIRLVKIKGKNGAAKMRRILEHTGGMLLVHAVAKTPEKTKIGHFFAVNTDMKVILDCQNGKGRCISYSSVDPNDAKLVENFFRAFNVISVGKLYRVQVRVDRISQYFPHFISV